MNGNYIVLTWFNPLKSGPLLFSGSDALRIDVSIIGMFLLSVFPVENLIMFVILWSSIYAFNSALSKGTLQFVKLMPIYGLIVELCLILSLSQSQSELLLRLLFPASLFILSLFTISFNIHKLRKYVPSFSLNKESRVLKVILGLCALTLIIMIPTLSSEYPALNVDLVLKVFLLITFNSVLAVVFGLAVWLTVKSSIGSPLPIDIFDLLSIVTIGLASVSIVTLVLLELRVFNLVSLSLLSVLLVFYLHLRFNVAKVVVSLVNALFRSVPQIVALSFVVVSVLYLYSKGQSWISLPWFDVWHWWGNAYQEALTLTIYDRYSFFFPGTTGMLSSSFITATLVLIPEKIVSLLYMRTLTVTFTILQALFVYYISSFLISKYLNNQSPFVAVLSVVSFLSSPWIIFYGTTYTRESLGLLLVLLLFLFVLRNREGFLKSQDQFPAKAFRVIVIASLLASLSVYFSEIEWGFIYPSMLVSLIWLKGKINGRKWRTYFLGFAVASLSMMPAFLAKLRSYLVFSQTPITEYIPNLNIVSESQSPSSQIYQGMFSSLIPTLNPSNLGSIMSVMGYAIMNSIGFIGFIVALVGFFYLTKHISKRTAEPVIIAYAFFLLCYPILLFAWPDAAVLLDLRRRFVPQLSTILAVFFSVGIASLSRKSTRFATHDFSKMVLILVVASQAIYPIQTISHMNFDSQTEVAEIMLQLDNILPQNFTIVASRPLLDQAEGLLAPRYVVRGEYFVSLFSQIPENASQSAMLRAYLSSGKVAILTTTGPFGLETMINSAPLLNISVLPLGNVRILLDNSQRAFIAILSNKTIEEELMEEFTLASVSDSSFWHHDVSMDSLSLRGSLVYWNLSEKEGWHNLFIPLKNSTDLTGFDFIKMGITLNNRSDMVHVFLRDDSKKRLLLYESKSLRAQPQLLILNPKHPIYTDPGFDFHQVVEMVIAHKNTESVSQVGIWVGNISSLRCLLNPQHNSQ